MDSAPAPEIAAPFPCAAPNSICRHRAPPSGIALRPPSQTTRLVPSLPKPPRFRSSPPPESPFLAPRCPAAPAQPRRPSSSSAADPNPKRTHPNAAAAGGGGTASTPPNPSLMSAPVAPSAPTSARSSWTRRTTSSSPPRSAATAETDPDSTASSSRPRTAATKTDPDSSASSSHPRATAAAKADLSASSASPRAAATQLCGAYASDIYTYLRSLEVELRRRPRADYIKAVQVDVTANMRTILVDWMVDVAEEYKLGADTLYLVISYIDRFLSANALSHDMLQLLGVAAMLIAA